MSPAVTAIITTNGRPASVREAIASVRTESYGDIELMVVDDGGGFAAGDRSLRVVRGAGLGVGGARNLGLSAARGEFVIFLDDDDVALPHRVSTLVSAAVRQDASLCFGMTRRVTDGTPEMLAAVPSPAPSEGAIRFCDLLACNPHVNAVLVRTDALREVGGFDVGARHFDDWSAWLRIADRGATVWSVADTVAEWRVHERGLSGRLMQERAMKTRLLALFARLESSLSEENGRAVAAAREIVEAAAITTYDDYADLLSALRDELHQSGSCFGFKASCRAFG